MSLISQITARLVKIYSLEITNIIIIITNIIDDGKGPKKHSTKTPHR